MAKAWVISLQPIDQSAAKRTIENISSRKKIAQVEEYLCELYIKMTGTQDADLKPHITRISGTVTSLEKAPYILSAELLEG